MPYLLGVAVAVGVLVSPDTLILLGNQMGSIGLPFLGVVVFAGMTGLGNAYSTAVLDAWFPGAGGEALGLQKALGTLPATVLPLCARVVVLICASTGMLAIAGYVFNEVFVHWFPNLGFSFCLLGLLLVLNLLGPRVAYAAQILFVAVVLLGLLGLSAMALLGNTLSFSTLARPTPTEFLHSALVSLWLFVGFDLVRFTPFSQSRATLPRGTYMTLGILLVGVTFCTWGVVSFGAVPAAVLANSTVPHMITARTLFGQPGRMVMGMVVLAGVSAAVNALLIGVSRLLVGMANQGFLPGFLAWAPQRAPVALLVLAFGPAVMMRLGMAGEPETEVYTRAGLIFWLLHYAAIHLAVVVLRRRDKQPPSRRLGLLLPALGMSLMGLGSVGLLWVDRTPGHLVAFMLAVAASMSVLSLGWIGWRHSQGRGVRSCAGQK